MVRIIGGQIFGLGNGIQAVVGADERERWVAATKQLLLEQPGCRQLHGIIRPQWVPSCQAASGVDRRRHNVQQVVPMCDVIVKGLNDFGMIIGQ